MPPGIPFGRYRLLRRLARGGMAEVFLARLHSTEGFERRLAIKRILPHLSDSEEFRAMFMDEARLAALLSHPNVVHIYEFGREGEHDFIAMEFVDGLSLGQMIHWAKNVPVSFEHAARIAADVCAGLHYAHHLVDGSGNAQELVHRDVSPQNILVTWDGVVKLVDFGIAKAAWQSSRTRPGMVKGKWSYMSPEQCEGRKLDGRSDIFSLGVVLYELLTGTPRYRRDDAEAAMHEIRDGKPIDLAERRPGIPDELVQIVRRATAVIRDGRYATAGEMQLHLERFLASRQKLTTAHLLGAHLKASYPRENLDGDEGESTGAEPAGTAADQVAMVTPTPAPAVVQQARAAESESAHTEVVKRQGAGRRMGWIAVGIASTALIALITWGIRRAMISPAATGNSSTTQVTTPPTLTATTPPPPVGPGPGPATGTPTIVTPPAADASVPDVPPALAALDLTTRPTGATLILDGRPFHSPTPIRAAKLAPGKHHLAIRHAGFEPRELELVFAAAEHRTLELDLTPVHATARPSLRTGSLTVRTLPWSKVYEGQRLLGTTPLAQVALSAGNHTLTFVNPDRPTMNRTVTIRSGKETRLSLELR
jgi:serine/threonine-protein kinase